MIPNGPELVIILVIALVLFGPSQLPKLGRSIGETMRAVREGLSPEEKPAPNEPEEE